MVVLFWWKAVTVVGRQVWYLHDGGLCHHENWLASLLYPTLYQKLTIPISRSRFRGFHFATATPSLSSFVTPSGTHKYWTQSGIFRTQNRFFGKKCSKSNAVHSVDFIFKAWYLAFKLCYVCCYSHVFSSTQLADVMACLTNSWSR